MFIFNEWRNKNENNKENYLYFVISMLLPNIFLFFLYNGNREASQIIFSHVTILALVLASISAAGLCLLGRLIIQNYEGSLLVLLLFWSLFWLFEAIFSVIPNRIIGSRSVLQVAMVVMVLGFAIAMRFISKNFYKIRIVFNTLSGVICLLFAFNFFPAVIANIRTVSAEESDFYIKREFTIDDTLPSPNIYWFHMDGMINFADMEYFFDEPQDELRQQLSERGFVINEDARFNAFNTMFGVPALLSPALYDSYLGELLAEKSRELHWERSNLLHETLENDDITLVDDIAPYHELFHAFLQSGYTVVSIASFDERVYVPLDHFYRLGSGDYIDDNPLTTGGILESSHFLQPAHELIELLIYTTPIPGRFGDSIRGYQFDWQSIPDYSEEINRLTANTLNLLHERQLYRSLIDSFTLEQPRLTYMEILFTHPSLSSQFDESHHVDIYPIAYEYAGNMMITMIDMILVEDQNAVIVVQADHGFHTHKGQEQLLETGLTEEEVAYLANSTMSAIRIPEHYDGLGEPLDPRNITREIVNRFVGQNYLLLYE